MKDYRLPTFKKFKGWRAEMACEEINKMFLIHFYNKKVKYYLFANHKKGLPESGKPLKDPIL